MSETSSSKVSDAKPRTRRRVVSAFSCSDHIVDTYSGIEVPTFDTVSGREWDSRSKSYMRQQLKIMFDDKQYGLKMDDIATWTDDDLIDLNYEVANILCRRDYLRDYAFAMIKRYSSTAKRLKGT